MPKRILEIRDFLQVSIALHLHRHPTLFCRSWPFRLHCMSPTILQTQTARRKDARSVKVRTSLA